ncbi:NYN domain-containing protein [Micromonospora sp. NPDC002717]|uniref:NYN domain-containing protein n=1 Tax=Micromonospora sp. NPDC002717 TaxID=3154424 RepID=UPI00331C5868
MDEQPALRLRRTALFVDFENVHIGLRNSSPEAARIFATDPGRWVRWMEQDLGPFRVVEEDEGPRALLRRICYLDPAASRQYRAYFTRAGFRVVDCPALTAMGKNSADIHMVLDIVDTLAHPTRFDEFIVLSADADFTPVLLRLREHDRRTAMLVNGPTAAALQAACDFAIPDTMFIEEALGVDGSADDEPYQLRVPSQPSTDSRTILATTDGQSNMALRARMEQVVRNLVRESPAPIDMATAAHAVRKAVGTVATTGWAGLGTFKQFIVSIQDERLVMDETQPGWLRDPTRHQPVAPVDVPEVAERVHRVVGVPLLSTQAYAALFQAIVEEGRVDKDRTEADSERAIRVACGRWSHAVPRQAVHFVLVGFHYARVDWRSASVVASELAGAFADNVLRLAANAQMDLTEEERIEIQTWIAGERQAAPNR